MNCCHSNLRSGSTLPPTPLPCANKYIVYTFTECRWSGGYGVPGSQTDKHLLQSSFTRTFFKKTTFCIAFYESYLSTTVLFLKNSVKFLSYPGLFWIVFTLIINNNLCSLAQTFFFSKLRFKDVITCAWFGVLWTKILVRASIIKVWCVLNCDWNFFCKIKSFLCFLTIGCF